MTSTLSSSGDAKARGGRGARPRLALQLVTALTEQIRAGTLAAGTKLPTESEFVHTYGVSRTVVREAISQLQASGLVETRHGIGTFVLDAPPGRILRIAPEHLATVEDLLALLELRATLESEAAALAALRRTDGDLAAMRAALDACRSIAGAGSSASASADFQFHLAIARSAGNRYFGDLLDHLGTAVIPRTRVATPALGAEPVADYMRRVHAEHEAIFTAIADGVAEAARTAMRTHLSNSRERLRRAREAAADAGDDRNR